MKLARFHKTRGDSIEFGYGCIDKTKTWDRIYITTMFTYNWDKIVQTIDHYKAVVAGDKSKIFVGGVMASLLTKQLKAKTGVNIIAGVLNSPSKISLPGNSNIDRLPPDYGILDPRLYAINDTYYAYTSRGCVNKCLWCGVPKIERKYVPYINIKGTITKLRKEIGDKPKLKLMDNNVLASPDLEVIVNDLIKLGYGKNQRTKDGTNRIRVIDFNQGLDASFITKKNMKLLSKLNIKPMRIAFDRINEKQEYVRALKIAKEYGVNSFSNYLLYNYKDNPKDLYQRLEVNINLNQRWKIENGASANIYSYPMRYAPIDSTDSPTSLSQQEGEGIPLNQGVKVNFNYNGMNWTRKFVRNIEIMKSATHGSISPTCSLARRTIGRSYAEFISNLYMPEELLRNRNKYEKKVYDFEPIRPPGNGDIEKFRRFIKRLIKKGDDEFIEFHFKVSQNSKPVIRQYIKGCKNKSIKKWLTYYLK